MCPVNGKWSDYTELSQSTRQIYYKTVRAIAAQYDNITMLDLTGEEYTPYFLCDTMHLGWKGCLPLIGQWLNSGTRIKNAILSKWYLTALFCALTAALVFAAWLLMDAQGVSFVYSEF